VPDLPVSAFKPGARVYHRKLDRSGTYLARVDAETSLVQFDDDHDYPSGRRVSSHLLERAA
jgi:hypothetical protein